MKKTITVAFMLMFLLVTKGRGADGIEKVLDLIKANNATLKTAQIEKEADCLENHVGTFLASPEVEYARLWGSPTEIRNRTDVSVKQTLDYATLSGMKSRLAKARDGLAGEKLRMTRQTVLLQARQTCIDVVYYNMLRCRLKERVAAMRAIADACKQRMDDGDADVLEYNKSRMGLAEAEAALSRAGIERETLMRSLQQMNGGHAVVLDDTVYTTIALPADFSCWLETVNEESPQLQFLSRQIEVGRREIKLAKAQNLPSISAGYMSEKTFGQHYQGLAVGLSVPLWENKNKTKMARDRMQADECRMREVRQQQADMLQSCYLRAVELQKLSDANQKNLLSLRHVALLDKALECGEITLTDYLLETRSFYEVLAQTIGTIRDCEKAKAELYAMVM